MAHIRSTTLLSIATTPHHRTAQHRIAVSAAMDQAVALTMSDKTAPPSREGTPVPKAAAAAAPAEPEVPATASATAETSASTAASPLQAVQQRAQEHGLYSGSFEEEVGQVVKSLGSFWGGFKAKSASTLTSLKSDLDKTVAQVQTDLKQLQETKVEVQTKTEQEWEAEQAAELEKAKQAREAEAATKAKGKGREEPPSSATLLSRLQSTALGSQLTASTTQLQASLQSTLASTLAKAKSNPSLDPTVLRTQLIENLRLSSAKENLTLSFQQAEKLAEEYLKKGGNLVRDAEAAAEKWVAENVKVVDPDSLIPMGNGDLYMFSTSSSSAPAQPSTGTPRPSLSSSALAGSRKEALLARLREDEALLLHDPAGSEETQQRRDEFALWIADKWPSVSKKEEEEHIGAIRMALVPEHLSDEVFWQRYLFHRDMIEAADAKRKELLETEVETEDFKWDDDEEVGETPTASAGAAVPAPVTIPATAAGVAKEEVKAEEKKESPRDSEESYDVVRTSTAAPSATTEDSDSDWE